MKRWITGKSLLLLTLVFISSAWPFQKGDSLVFSRMHFYSLNSATTPTTIREYFTHIESIDSIFKKNNTTFYVITLLDYPTGVTADSQKIDTMRLRCSYHITADGSFQRDDILYFSGGLEQSSATMFADRPPESSQLFNRASPPVISLELITLMQSYDTCYFDYYPFDGPNWAVWVPHVGCIESYGASHATSGISFRLVRSVIGGVTGVVHTGRHARSYRNRMPGTSAFFSLIGRKLTPGQASLRSQVVLMRTGDKMYRRINVGSDRLRGTR
jgi:hypothetical protein